MTQSPPSNYPAGGLMLGIVAMSVVVAASNYLVQIPINNWLTWGAFTYPIAFLVTDLSNRRFGPDVAKKVVYAGFALGVVLSIVLQVPLRIAIASGAAFLIAQLFDVWLFNRLRGAPAWWRAPVVSSTAASALDTVLFFSLAFAMTEVPWVTLAAGDYMAKLVVAGVMLIPFRMMMGGQDWSRTQASTATP